MKVLFCCGCSQLCSVRFVEGPFLAPCDNSPVTSNAKDAEIQAQELWRVSAPAALRANFLPWSALIGPREITRCLSKGQSSFLELLG